jgi:hypothetical protein
MWMRLLRFGMSACLLALLMSAVMPQSRVYADGQSCSGNLYGNTYRYADNLWAGGHAEEYLQRSDESAEGCSGFFDYWASHYVASVTCYNGGFRPGDPPGVVYAEIEWFGWWGDVDLTPGDGNPNWVGPVDCADVIY